MAEHEQLPWLSTESKININLCLSDDDHIRCLNRDFRHLDQPTNVLSFANIDFEDFAKENELFETLELGDIIIAFETVQKQAIEQEITLSAHFCHLLTHGILHLLGYDHQTPAEASEMESLEANVLARLNIENPYAGEE